MFPCLMQSGALIQNTLSSLVVVSLGLLCVHVCMLCVCCVHVHAHVCSLSNNLSANKGNHP